MNTVPMDLAAAEHPHAKPCAVPLDIQALIVSFGHRARAVTRSARAEGRPLSSAGAFVRFDSAAALWAEGSVAGAANATPIAAPLLARARLAQTSRLKRALDLVGAMTALVLLFPVLLLIALAIRLDSRGPILFRQDRYGADRRIFSMHKFRTMTVLESSGPFEQAQAADRRVTRIGRLLRRTSLDELPQLVNVLAGEMSLVGPRPHAVAMDDVFAAMIDCYGERHLVRPGLTGLAQVSGYRGPTDALAKIRGRVRCDRAYIRRWSILVDLAIIWRTPAALFGPDAF